MPQQVPPAHQNDKPHELGVGALPTLASNDVPLLRGTDDDLSGADLLLAQLVVTSQFCNSDAVCGQALGGGKACQVKMLAEGLGTKLSEKSEHRVLEVGMSLLEKYQMNEIDHMNKSKFTLGKMQQTKAPRELHTRGKNGNV